ncbi:MAG: site-specific integrase [Alphaproteobacteria bacterium]
MANIEKRISKQGQISYRVRVRLKGHPTQYATFPRLTDAKKWIQDTESAIRNGRHFKASEAKRQTLSDLIVRYLEWVKARNTKRHVDVEHKLKWWDNELGYMILADLTKAKINETLEKLSNTPKKNGAPRSHATVNRYAVALSHALSIATNEWEWLEQNPMQKLSKLPEPRGRVRFLDEEERKKLLYACSQSQSKYLYIVVVLALSTGARQGEILGLRWPDIDFKRGAIVLHDTKNKERRTLPLTGRALALMKEHQKIRRIDTDLVFPARSGEKPIDIRESWLVAIEKAGIENFRFHDLRHSAASYLAMNGASLAEIAEVMGHKTLAMVKRYAHLSDAHTHSVVSSMNERIFGYETK